MPDRHASADQALTRRVRAEAASWLAHLHSDRDTGIDDAGFRAWLDQSDCHRLAFERATASWDAAGGYAPQPATEHAPVTRRRMLAGTAVAAVAGSAGLWLWQRGSAQRFETRPGEQRREMLADGSSIMLDSDSALDVRFGRNERQVRLERGRAWFAVAKDRTRPFSVEVGGQEVVAVGTAFTISRDAIGAAVTLVEGKVLVRSDSAPLAMRPGDRISFNHRTGRVNRDRPDMARLTAWERGLFVFDDDPLAQVIAQANVYSGKALRIDDPVLGSRRVSGTFKIGDGRALAEALGALLDIPITERNDAILLGSTGGEKSAAP